MCEGLHHALTVVLVQVYFSWANGATFDGIVCKGKKHGRGTLCSIIVFRLFKELKTELTRHYFWIISGVHTFSDGRVYNGNFENGKQHGFGSLTHPDGVKYRGQFCNGLKEGYGIMLWRTRTYDGEWKNDKPEGQGRVVWKNGATYTGNFHRGKYDGLGVYVWPSGKRFVGRWSDGVKSGHGLYTWPSGKKYDGEYKSGMRHGYGRMTWPDGETYSGGYANNERSGRGVQTSSTGEILHCGLWKNDKPVGPTEKLSGPCPIPYAVMVKIDSMDDVSLIGQERDICSEHMLVSVDDDDDVPLAPHRPTVTA
jgi:hypothetical protein